MSDDLEITGTSEDEYGEKLNHVRATQRIVLATIMPRHGAYLIGLHDEEGDLTPDQLYDVAGSEKRARRVARWMIGKQYPAATGLRFQRTTTGWDVVGTLVDEYSQYADTMDGSDE